MVSILISAIFAAIVVAIRYHITFGSLARPGIAREDIAIARERAELPGSASPMKQFLVVVLPDGKVVHPRIADHF